MIPMRLTGKPFWEIEVNQDPDLTFAYINAAKYFGIDAWLYNGDIQIKQKSEVWVEKKIVKKEADRWEIRSVYHTPDGDMTQTMISPIDNSATMVEKLVKNFKEDFNKLKHLFSDVVSYDASVYGQLKKEMGEQGMICIWCSVPGFPYYNNFFEGNLEAVTYAYYDYPDLFEELVYLHDRRTMQELEIAIDAGAESVLTGGSGSITMQSPEIWRKLALPTIKKITKRCKEAGIISGIHSCGKERYLVETCANETDLNYVNPLEIPVMGDCNLAECKEKFGRKLALMGNLHTTEVMLYGSVTDVRRESLKAIRDAGKNGGFVLSTGDQCGRDTPDENIFEMVKVAKEFGAYPLDTDKIECEIKRLEKLSS
ncbi:MAG: hypothetical protein FIA99_07315 [Ruminiclostridium sp.]|nr:hypothetical protein [Ruminiclostridium sp.]